MRNTVVRATIKVNAQPWTLTTRSPLTSQSIKLKFDTDAYVGGVTHMPKMVKVGPLGPARQRGEIRGLLVISLFFIFRVYFYRSMLV